MLSDLIEAMQTKLVDYNNFVRFRKSKTILIFLWGRAYQKLLYRVSNEFTTQLVEDQLKVTQELELNHLRDDLLEVLKGFQSQIYSGQRMYPINVMNHNEKTCVNLGMLKGLKRKH